MHMQLDPNRFEACPAYNDWLDESYSEASGTLDILGFQPRPSEVLFRLSPDTYQASFADFCLEWEEQLKEKVESEFPSPIAHYFYRFNSGYESELQRLHFLRDTWESIVDVLHAMTVAECRYRRLRLADPVKMPELMSESVAARLTNIERIFRLATNAGGALKMSSIVQLATLQKMRELNRSRNGFSHSAAQSEAQARGWIHECYSDVIDVLDEIRGLADVDIYRYMGQDDASTLRCEAFYGHGFTRTIKRVTVTGAQAAASQRYFLQGQILVMLDGDLFGLRPFIFFREDAVGQATRLCLFRKPLGDAPDRRIEYEIVGDAVRLNEPRLTFQSEIDEIRALFGLQPE
jgi:hypothetical protein